MLHDKYLAEMLQPEFVSTSAVTHVLGGKEKKITIIMRNKHSAGAYYVVRAVGNYTDQNKCD